MYFRDTTATIKDVRQHRLWVALEAGSGIVSQHDYDPESSCAGWSGCSYFSHGEPGAWWNVTNDPIDPSVDESPLWAFTTHRALNRLALRTKLQITTAAVRTTLNSTAATEGATPAGDTLYATPPPKAAGGALAYLKHDAMGPHGDACVMVFNPGAAQSVTVDLSSLPPAMLTGQTVPHDLLAADGATGPPLSGEWTVAMKEGEVKAFGGFRLASFAPRVGKKGNCKPDDGYDRPAAGETLQACFLECLRDAKCGHVHVEYVEIVWMEKPPPLRCTLLGAVSDPSSSCESGTGTLVKKLTGGRPTAHDAATSG